MKTSIAGTVNLEVLLGGWPRARLAGSAIDALPPGRPIGSDGGGDGGSGRATLHEIAVKPTRPSRCDTSAPIGALFVRPPGPGPFPAVLYCHAHGHDYVTGRRELVEPRRSLPAGPYGQALAARGIASLCIDQPGFGARRLESEDALVKRYLWRGDTLFGGMLRELAAALDALESMPWIDPKRVATLGLSMGCTTAWWLAAMDERVRAVAALCCLADVSTLIDSGAHDLHGHYLTVPSLPSRFRTAQVAMRIAPRPLLVGYGERDPLTPRDAVEAVLEPLGERYRALGARKRLVVVREPDGGHEESPAMRAAVLRFLDAHLLGRERATDDQSA